MPLVDFAPGDAIDLTDSPAIAKVVFDQNTGTLTLDYSLGGSFTLHLLGNYTGDSFHASLSHGDALITVKA